MLHRASTRGAVLVATIAAAVASIYITPPWDMFCTVLAAAGAATSMLLLAIRFEVSRRL